MEGKTMGELDKKALEAKIKEAEKQEKKEMQQ